jgi:hypothetical protein
MLRATLIASDLVLFRADLPPAIRCTFAPLCSDDMPTAASPAITNVSFASAGRGLRRGAAACASAAVSPERPPRIAKAATSHHRSSLASLRFRRDRASTKKKRQQQQQQLWRRRNQQGKSANSCNNCGRIERYYAEEQTGVNKMPHFR